MEWGGGGSLYREGNWCLLCLLGRVRVSHGARLPDGVESESSQGL